MLLLSINSYQWTEVENELTKKKEEMRVTGAEQVLTGPEFKKYIGMIRNKGNVYKAKRAEVGNQILKSNLKNCFC